MKKSTALKRPPRLSPKKAPGALESFHDMHRFPRYHPPAQARSLSLRPQRGALDGVGQQHLLGEDQVRARVVGELVVVAHRDCVERAGHLAIAAENAAA